MSPALTVLSVVIPVALLLAALLHHETEWKEEDEQYAQLDEQLDAERDYVRWVESLPTLPFDAERLGS